MPRVFGYLILSNGHTFDKLLFFLEQRNISNFKNRKQTLIYHDKKYPCIIEINTLYMFRKKDCILTSIGIYEMEMSYLNTVFVLIFTI